MQRRRALVMLASSAIGGAGVLRASSRDDEGEQLNREAWVSDVLQEMLTIKPGMTRSTLLTIFTTEGGLSSRTWRRYVNRRCRLFKVDVEFQQVGEPDIGDTPAFLYEGDNDLIVKISHPFLEFEITD